MKKYIYKRYLLAAFFVVSIFGMNSVSAFASMNVGGEGRHVISTVDELISWYNADKKNDYPSLESDIVIDGKISLPQTSVWRELVVIGSVLRVAAGGELTIDNSNFALAGPGTVIIVEAGGTLVINHCNISTAPDSDCIVIETGGSFIRSETFKPDSGNILDKNEDVIFPPSSEEPEETEEPKETEETGNTEETEAMLTPLYSLIDTKFYFYCYEGDIPEELAFPMDFCVSYQDADNKPVQVLLPVSWQLEGVDFNTAGVYRVEGIFSEEMLAENGLSNPKNLRAQLIIDVRKPGPITSFQAFIISIRKGTCTLQLKLPVLPEDTREVYIYRSSDGITWNKAYNELPMSDGSIQRTEDHLSHSVVSVPNQLITYRYQTDYEHIWLKIEIVGSIYEGYSNTVKVELPSGLNSDNSIIPDNPEVDDGSGGNRGGGGQDEAVRDTVAASPPESESSTELGTPGQVIVEQNQSLASPKSEKPVVIVKAKGTEDNGQGQDKKTDTDALSETTEGIQKEPVLLQETETIEASDMTVDTLSGSRGVAFAFAGTAIMALISIAAYRIYILLKRRG